MKLSPSDVIPVQPGPAYTKSEVPRETSDSEKEEGANGCGTQLASSDVVKSMYFDTMNKYTAPIPI